MKLTVGQKILLGYGLAMLFLALTGIAGYRGTVRLLEANYWVRHTYMVIGEARDIRGLLLQFQNSLRDTSSPVMPVTWNRARAYCRAWPRARNQLAGLPSTIPVNRAGLHCSHH